MEMVLMIKWVTEYKKLELSVVPSKHWVSVSIII